MLDHRRISANRLGNCLMQRQAALVEAPVVAY
jgi:hypothetical protein